MHSLSGYIAIIADLMIPLFSEMFIDYVICDNKPTNDGVFSFMLSGKYGEIHSMKLFFSLAIIFMIFLVTRIILIYVKNITNQHLGLNLETDLRVVTFRKLMELDSETISEYNTGELLTTINSDTIMYKELFCRMIPNIFDSIFVLIIMCISIITY